MKSGEFQDFLKWIPAPLLIQLLQGDRSELLLRKLEKEMSPKAFQNLMLELLMADEMSGSGQKNKTKRRQAS